MSKSFDYWADRQAKAQTNLTKKNIKQTEAQLIKYYRKAMDECLNEFEFVYLKLLNTKDGIKPTPADLYKLDKYWEMQGQISKILTGLGDKQASFLSKMFTNHYADIYSSIGIDGSNIGGFRNIDRRAVEQLINQVWCADGKTAWSRIWENQEKLQQMLNDGLIECVALGASTEDLKKQLMMAFDVSYSRADSLVKTELAHIQTQAAADRYRDAGIKEFKVWADEDERRCKVCGKLHNTNYLVGENPPIPAHPNCRCTIIPVVE